MILRMHFNRQFDKHRSNDRSGVPIPVRSKRWHRCYSAEQLSVGASIPNVIVVPGNA